MPNTLIAGPFDRQLCSPIIRERARGMAEMNFHAARQLGGGDIRGVPEAINLTPEEKVDTDTHITSLGRKGRVVDKAPAVSGEFEQASEQEQDPLASKPVPFGSGDSNQLSIRKEFVDSVAVAENAVAQVANNLERLIRRAQRFTPSDVADQKVLVGDIDVAIRLGVTLETKGEKLRCLTLQSGRALSWRTSKHGYLGFRKHSIDVDGPQVSRCETA